MEEVLIHKIDNQYLSNMPEDSGVLKFFSGSTLLYISETVNLRYKLSGLWLKKDEELTLGELFSKADRLEIIQTKSPLDALLEVKTILEKEKAEYNNRINSWKEYVYLAINPAEFPFVKITEYTEEEWFYIGPFRSRFFLVDIMELMNKMLKIPFCETQTSPCEKMDDGRCRGWCLLIKSESENESEENAEQTQLQKLDALLKEAFVHPDNGLLELVINEKEKYENELQFTKAEFLKPEIELLKHYKDWLIFLYKIKNLNFVTDTISVKNGQLVRYKKDGEEHLCPYIKIEYRLNELLALNKNLVDEARILYQERV